MAQCGIARIDSLFAESPAAAPIVQGDGDVQAVGAIQDLLACHGFAGMPGLLSPQRGMFGPRTRECVVIFQARAGLPTSGSVDSATLRSLAREAASSPVISQGYVTLVLDLLYQGMTRLVGLTSQFEGAGKFGAMNLNSDKCGLSFGLIQWSQKPGRLSELLRAFRAAEPAKFIDILGAGDARLADALITHTGGERGGTNGRGETTDMRFDLLRSPWRERFQQAARDQALQKAQLRTAEAAFSSSLEKLREYCPEAGTERGAAFMLDLANQHGDRGAREIYRSATVGRPRLAAPELFVAMEEESVNRVSAQYGAASNEAVSTRRRRSDFRTSPLLSNSPIVLR